MNFKKFLREHREAFTLAEVVIVMAILSIMMVAFAPVVTKKTTTTGDAFRTFMRNSNNDAIYYGTAAGHKGVFIGTNSSPYGGDGFYPKLTLMQNRLGDESTLAPAIAFLTSVGENTSYAGQLLIVNNGTDKGGTVILGGNIYDANKESGSYAQLSSDIGTKSLTIIGGDACSNVDSSTTNVVCIGALSGNGNIESDPIIASNSIFIGRYDVLYDTANIHIGNTTLADIVSDAVAMAGLDSRNGAIDDGTKLAFMTEDVIPSDERLKNVGKPYTEGLEMINKIEPVNFTYKRDENKYPHVGVIAQALQKIFPNAVQENKEGYLYIRTEDMFYAAINAIKELHQYFLGHDKRIQQLEARNAVLEQQNKELQELYTELAKRVERLDKKKTKNVNFTPIPAFEEQTVRSQESVEEVKTEE